MALKPEYIVIGRFGRAHGVSGEIYINPITDNPRRFHDLESFWLESENGWREMAVAGVKFISGRPVIKIAGLDNANAVVPLQEKLLYIKSNLLEALPAGEYYHFDLLECRVIDMSERERGKVVEIEKYPANDVMVIKNNDKEYRLPLVRRFLKKIDIENKVIVIDPPEGTFDSPDEN